MKTFSNKPVTLMAMLTIASMWMVACQPSRPANYTTDLAQCNLTAKTCQESIACENEVRAKYKRSLRDASKGCE